VYVSVGRLVSRQTSSSSLEALPNHLIELGNAVSKHAQVISARSFPFLLSVLMGNREENVEEILCDPFTECEVFNGVSILGEEIATFLGKSILFSNLLSVVGQSFAIASRFLSSSMTPEQLVVQSILLSSSLGQLSKNFDIQRQSNSRELTPNEVRAFKAYFCPAGLPIGHYKTLVTLSADWITVEEGESILDLEAEEHLYWLYQGNVEIISETATYQVSKDKGPRLSDKDNFCRMGILGDLQFFRECFDINSRNESTPLSNKVSLCAGSGGATLMRIDIASLVNMMRHDEYLAKSVKSLIFKSMEDKAFASLP
jgi:hypothetical protein